MKKINLSSKKNMSKLVSGENLYFAEENLRLERVWDEGCTEKLKELEEELIGLPVRFIVKEFWFSDRVKENCGIYRGIRQITNGSRSAGDPVSKTNLVYYWRTNSDGDRIETFRNKVVLPGDLPNEVVTDLKSALPTYDFKYVGGSGFAARNSWIVTGCPSEVCQVIVMKVWPLQDEEARNVGLPLHPAVDSSEKIRWIAVSASIEEQEIFDTSAVDAAYAHVINERRRRKQIELVGENPPAVLKVEIGGKTGFTEQHLPEGYTKLFEVVTAYMQDYRQGRTHQRLVWAVDAQRVKHDGHRRIMLDIPSKHRGKFIGKGGKNIKELEAKIGLKITLSVD